MNEAKVARNESTKGDERPQVAGESTLHEIRLLDELELALAGGGDLIDGWP